MIVTDVDGTYTDDDARTQLIERTAKAIFQADVFGLRPLSEGTDLRELWNAELATSRIRYRNQARAALGASELLKRVEELERAVAASLADLDAYAHDQDGNAWARRDVTLHLRKVHKKS